MLFALSLLVPAAHAQDVTGGETPSVDALPFRSDAASEKLVRVMEATTDVRGIFGAASFGYAKQPVVYTPYVGDGFAIVDNLITANIEAGFAADRWRASVDIPVIVRSFGGSEDDGTGLGKIGVDAMGVLVKGPVNLGVYGRTALPTSTLGGAVGGGGVGWGAGVSVDKEFGDLYVAANAGVGGGKKVSLENVTLGTALDLGLGVQYRLTETVGVSAEVNSRMSFPSFGEAPATPTEALLGSNIRVGNVVLQPAVGMGIVDGVGASAFTGQLSVGYLPKEKKAAPPPPAPVDTDGDGLVDPSDKCPSKAEDKDSFEDSDGCPEPTAYTVTIVDSDGVTVGDATWSWGDAKGTSGQGGNAEAGKATFKVKAYGKDTELAADLPAGAPVSLKLNVPAPRADVVVNVVDAAGKAVPGAQWSSTVNNVTLDKLTPGKPTAVRPGNEVVLAARADGFRPGSKTVLVKAEGANEVFTLQMEPSTAKATKERVDIKGTVLFELNKADIKPESFGLLNDVSEVLKAHPEITKLSIEGHTDAQGDAVKNKTLSEERAAAVRTYLINKGVSADRLTSAGFGEDRLLDKANNEKAHAKNRRVDFVITGRSDEAPK
jgi:outer membrane protein OmpA-like peptidoglycan-associated protein